MSLLGDFISYKYDIGDKPKDYNVKESIYNKDIDVEFVLQKKESYVFGTRYIWKAKKLIKEDDNK